MFPLAVVLKPETAMWYDVPAVALKLVWLCTRLPKSSLLMLVAAFAGRELTLAAYRHAVSAGFRFYSYGDAMLIL